MWYPWLALLVSCALAAEAAVTEGPALPAATTRAPLRTLDRQPGELAWFQYPVDGSQNAPHRRITTKSLFVTPVVCPKGHQFDGTACVQVVTVEKDEHERILLHQLNSHFPVVPNNGDMAQYDYGDEDLGPFQFSIPIGIDPQQEPSAQAPDPQGNNVKIDKKGENTDASVEAELELLKLQQAHAKQNNTQNAIIVSHNVLHNLLTYSDKPKRDSPMINSTEIESSNSTDEGQKELVFGHVNVDPVMYDTDNQNNQAIINEYDTEKTNEPHAEEQNDAPSVNTTIPGNLNNTTNSTGPVSKKDIEDAKLNPENDYSDIGEAIKLISRFAEVSTDDNFTKDDKNGPLNEDSILGTRTKVQYRRNRPKPTNRFKKPETFTSDIPINNNDVPNEKFQPQHVVYYRYPWPSENSGSQPASNYPFRHLQDYWPGRSQVGGVYNTMHGNPRRHHHSYPHYFHPRGYQYVAYPNTHPDLQAAYSGRRYPHKIIDHNPSHTNNQDLYSLLGLRHWFSSEGATKR